MSAHSRRRPHHSDDQQDIDIRHQLPTPSGSGHSAHVIDGTGGIDFIIGSNGMDVINGLAGNDNLQGGRGDDILDGGEDDDTLWGGTGKDTLYGGTGNDLLSGSGHDLLLGGGGNDQFKTAANDIAEGGAGNDVFYVFRANAKLDGGTGTDALVFDAKVGRFKITYKGDGMLFHDGTLNWAIPKLTTRIGGDIEQIAFRDLLIDRQHFAAPEILSVSNNGDDAGAGGIMMGAVQQVKGISDPFARITVRIDGDVVGQTMANASGNWNLSGVKAQLATGDHQVTATADFGLSGKTSKPDAMDFTTGKFIDLHHLKAHDGVTLQGRYQFEMLGSDVSALGDVNGDGIDDVLVSSESGLAYVIYGQDGPLGNVKRNQAFFAPAYMDADEGFSLKWTYHSNLQNQTVTTAGDFNGDGLSDLIMGGSGYEEGAAVIVFGGNSGLDVTGQIGSAVLDVDQLTSSEALYIRGPEIGSIGGIQLGSAGDVNGDGVDDIVIGASWWDNFSARYVAEAYVVFGSAAPLGVEEDGRRVLDISALSPDQGFVVRGWSTKSYFTAQVSRAGDVNGDGLDDIIVSTLPSKEADPDIFVIYGGHDGFGTPENGRSVLDLAGLAPDQGLRIKGPDSKSDHISDIGDFNGDGYDDILIGNQTPDGEIRGHAYVVYGRAGEVEDVIDLDHLTEDLGFTIANAKGSHRVLGIDVAAAGDFNGDGLDDIVISGSDVNIIYGTRGPVGDKVGEGRFLDTDDISARQGMLIAVLADARVSSAGDVNHDGYDDLVLGEPDIYTGDLSGIGHIIYGGNFSSSRAVTQTGTTSAEILLGSARNDVLDGGGGADIFRSGAGNDMIRIGDAMVGQIHAGRGRDTVALAGAGIDLDLQEYSNGQMTGIERFDLTGSDNRLTLAAADIFHFSAGGYSAFPAAQSTRNLVIDGDAGDGLTLVDDIAADAAWQRNLEGVKLDGTAGGAYDVYDLVKAGSGAILASIAVDADIAVL